VLKFKILVVVTVAEEAVVRVGYFYLDPRDGGLRLLCFS